VFSSVRGPSSCAYLRIVTICLLPKQDTERGQIELQLKWQVSEHDLLVIAGNFLQLLPSLGLLFAYVCVTAHCTELHTLFLLADVLCKRRQLGTIF